VVSDGRRARRDAHHEHSAASARMPRRPLMPPWRLLGETGAKLATIRCGYVGGLERSPRTRPPTPALAVTRDVARASAVCHADNADRTTGHPNAFDVLRDVGVSSRVEHWPRGSERLSGRPHPSLRTETPHLQALAIRVPPCWAPQTGSNDETSGCDVFRLIPPLVSLRSERLKACWSGLGRTRRSTARAITA
jgi:hypothetical protein